MTLEAISDPEATQNKQKNAMQGRHTLHNKTKRSRRPLQHASPDTRALRHTGAEWAGGVTR